MENLWLTWILCSFVVCFFIAYAMLAGAGYFDKEDNKMESETRFCNECGAETIHIEGECIDCSLRRAPDLEEKLKEDEEDLERRRLESKRRPK